jgi:aldehyde:ferredoxin oxidoreductase
MSPPQAASLEELPERVVVADRAFAIVNLTNGQATKHRIPVAWRRRFLGGRGLNVFLLTKFLPREADPLGPDNVLIFGAGLLTGTVAPSSSRMSVTFLSPESYILGDGNIGGFFGAEMRNAGFDHIVCVGRAPKPSYLWIEGGRIEVRDASGFWGTETIQVQEDIRKALGRCEMVVTGVAGERLVRFASVRSGLKRSARCGGGAVMGSKNLKALVARGNETIPTAYPEQLLTRGADIHEYVTGSKISKVLGTVGTAFLYDTSNAIGAIRTKNSQLNQWTDAFNSDKIEHRVTKMVSCSGCSVHCTHRNVHGGEGPEYSTTGIMGANIGIADTDELIKLNNLCNDLGFDTSSTGTYLAWAMELFERGLITEKLTGEPLRWGDYDQVARLLHMTSRREGFGNVLAEGSQAVRLGYYPREAMEYFIGVKGLPQSDPHDVRYLKAFGLGLAVASRGADHLRNRPTLEIFMNIPLDEKERIYGKGVTRDPTAYEGKAVTVAFSDDMFAVVDSAGICKFVTHGFNSPNLVKFEHVRDLLHLTAGIKLSSEALRKLGATVIDIERFFNTTRCGVTRADDTLPKRYFDDPMPLGMAKGHQISRDGFEVMLQDYYALRGWQRDGQLTRERRGEFESWLAEEAPPLVATAA